jgi:hypothetical protein
VLLTGKDFTPSGVSKLLIAASLASFVGAGALGIFANANRRYQVTAKQTHQRMLNEHWVDDEIDARNYVATLNLATLDTLRDGNNVKVWFLSAALICQVIAIALLGAAIIVQVSI